MTFIGTPFSPAVFYYNIIIKQSFARQTKRRYTVFSIFATVLARQGQCQPKSKLVILRLRKFFGVRILFNILGGL
jgi:hypothetical protein